MRADENEEITGMDIGEHGERAYNQSLVTADSMLTATVESFATAKEMKPVNAK